MAEPSWYERLAASQAEQLRARQAHAERSKTQPWRAFLGVPMLGAVAGVFAFLATRSPGFALVAALVVAALWVIVVVVLLRAESPDPNSRLGRFEVAWTQAVERMPAPERSPEQARRHDRLLRVRMLVLVVGAVATVVVLWLGFR